MQGERETAFRQELRPKRVGIFVVTFPLLLLCLACSPRTATNPIPPKGQVEALVKQSWPGIEKALPRPDLGDTSGPPGEVVGWDYVISPPFPGAWPPDGQGLLYYYAYASGFRPGLVDADVVAAPWGRVKVDATGEKAPQMELLHRQLREASIQAVRPLKQEEITAYQSKERVEAQIFLLSKASSPKGVDAAAIRQYYCLWSKDNGVVAHQIRPFHPGFLNWLDCRQVAAPGGR